MPLRRAGLGLGFQPFPTTNPDCVSGCRGEVDSSCLCPNTSLLLLRPVFSCFRPRSRSPSLLSIYETCGLELPLCGFRAIHKLAFSSWRTLVHFAKCLKIRFIRFQMPEEWPYEEVGRLFEDPEIKWSPPAEEGLLNFLVSKNGFNHDKVTKVVHKEVVHKATISRKLVLAFMGSAFKNKGIPADRAYISPLALAIASPSNHLHCSSFPTIRI